MTKSDAVSLYCFKTAPTGSDFSRSSSYSIRLQCAGHFINRRRHFINDQESNIDLSPLVDTAATLASAVFAALAPIVVLKLDRMLKLNLDQAHRAAIATALDNALGLGLQLAQEAGDSHLSNANIRSAALTAMVGYVKQTVPAAVTHFGLTDASIAQKAAGRLAAALHVSALSTPVAAAVTLASPIPAAA